MKNKKKRNMKEASKSVKWEPQERSVDDSLRPELGTQINTHLETANSCPWPSAAQFKSFPSARTQHNITLRLLTINIVS